MADTLTELDRLLLDRWPDTVGLWEAINDLEDRLGATLKRVAEKLTPWLEDQGFQLVDVVTKDASFGIVHSEWLNKNGEPLISAWISEVYPYGYRKVKEEHPYIWVYAELPEEQEEAFQREIGARLANHVEGWLNDDCDAEYPAGRYFSNITDGDRIRFALSETALEEFLRDRIAELVAIAPALTESLDVALTAKATRGR